MATSTEKSNGNSKEEVVVIVPKTAAEAQRIKLDKLMKNPSKPVVLPDGPSDSKPRVFTPPEFIRNVWGSSAGAGSGDFHVYRGIRRREYARQKFSNEKSKKEEEDEKYVQKVLENQKNAEERTAKKRTKRLKKKANKKAKMQKSTKKSKTGDQSGSEDERSGSEEENPENSKES